ncbi:MAG: hypothetical protein JWQ10_3693 [Herbaspirillum sp.]|jgi:hypothetical protein|nr:hypothetical protein [Herbaspirillum sp.]
MNFQKVFVMTTPVSQGAIAAPYIPSPVQESKLPQAAAGSAPESAAQAGAKELLGVLGLTPALMADEKNKESILDVIDRTFAKVMAGYDKQLEEIKAKKLQQKGAIDDLSLIRKIVTEYKNAHSDETGAIDLSNVVVTLPKSSPLYAEGKRTMKLSELTAYYQKEHSELNLPDMPKTMGELKFTQDQVTDALRITLEPDSQQAFTDLQRCMQERTAMWNMQSTMYRIIFDGFRKLNP